MAKSKKKAKETPIDDRQIFEYLVQHPGRTPEQIAQDLGSSVDLASLLEDGRLNEDDGRYYVSA